jgi:glycerophosphoryl diester phosphodiesterase
VNAAGASPTSLGWLIDRPIAHRGLHNADDGIVENTSGAFARAMEHGYAIECDLQVSADGEAMVFHDNTLERLTQGKGSVNEMNFHDLQRVPLKRSRDHMHALAQLLAQVNDAVPLVIELKSRFDDSSILAKRTCEIMSGYHGRFCLMSFDPFMMNTIKRIAPHIPRGLVMDTFKPEDWPSLSLSQLEDLRDPRHILDVDPQFMSSALIMLDSDKVRAFRATGKPVICWTVTSASQAQECYKLCDQITFEGFLA